jgi:hypothetical protein
MPDINKSAHIESLPPRLLQRARRHSAEAVISALYKFADVANLPKTATLEDQFHEALKLAVAEGLISSPAEPGA